LIPGDATQTILGPPATSGASPAAYAALRHQLGLDHPLWDQYWGWLSAALHGDLGRSLITKQAVTQAIIQRFPVTLSLAIGGLLVSAFFGVGLGLVSAIRGGALGRSVDVLAMFGWAIPGYWIAAQTVVIFAITLHWLPAIGYVPLAQSPVQWVRSLILPVAAIALATLGSFAKFTRYAMLEALSSEYVRMARANGVPRRSIILQHALKTASLPVLTQAGLLTVGLLSGTVFIEIVFALPGMGSLIVDGTKAHDIPMVQGVTVFYTMIVVVVNLVVDLAYGLLDPRVRVA
jgi:peptide/nickel transport system permease protein